MSKTIYEHWATLCYIPHNTTFSLFLRAWQKTGKFEDAKSYLPEEWEKMQARKKEHPADFKELEGLMMWVQNSMDYLIGQAVEQLSLGDWPQLSLSPEALMAWGNRLIAIPGLKFNGWATPQLKTRHSLHHAGGSVVDIIPADPRFGGIVPSWTDKDPEEEEKPYEQ